MRGKWIAFVGLVLFWSNPSFASYNIVAHTIAQSNNNANVMTGTIDTTGADLIVICISDYSANGVASQTPTDSKLNSYTGLTSHDNGTYRNRCFYKQAPIVGSGHTFSETSPGSAIYPEIEVWAFSGSVASPFDVENGTTATVGSSLATGSVTPGSNNELLITSSTVNSGVAPTVDSGFSVSSSPTMSLAPVGAQSLGGGSAYLIQTSASAVNPTWTMDCAGGGGCAVSIATFKAAATGGGAALYTGPMTGAGK